MIHVVIADDHHLVRQGLRALLEKQPEIVVVGEAQDGEEAYSMTKRLEPDVLVLDINMPRLNGIEVTKKISEERSNTQVLILSMYSDDSLVKKAFRNGARGYLWKNSITEDLLGAVNAASLRQFYISPGLASSTEINPEQIVQGTEEWDLFEYLTAREREVCQLVVEGYTNGGIANTLGISVKTVEKHRANMMEKMGVKDLAGLIRVAVTNGIAFLER